MSVTPAAVFALLAAACFGAALVVNHCGLRYASSYTGARLSLTSALVLWCALAPLLLDVSGWKAAAVAIFAVVGIFYPAAVTVINNESNRVLGPTLTGMISSSTPLFATALAALLLGERLTLPVAIGGLTVVSALVVMSWRPSGGTHAGWRVLLPLSGAALRGVAQTLGKLGLELWPNPYAATLIGYTVSSAAIWGAKSVLPGAGDRFMPAAMLWFAGAGVLNGSAVLLLYQALQTGSVAVVAPLAALYPFFTMLFSAIFLRSEALTRRLVSGGLLAIVGVVVLVSA